MCSRSSVSPCFLAAATPAKTHGLQPLIWLARRWTSPTDSVAEAFEAQRDRLRAVAYRMLGSHADAEDVVQETWLRLSRQDTATIHNLAGWLTTVVGRISFDVLRSRQARPEASYDDRLPELVVTVDDSPAPEDDMALADSVGLALLVVLESLRPTLRGVPGGLSIAS